MNARQFIVSSLSIGTLALASTLTAAPTQARPASSPWQVTTTAYTAYTPATIAFQNTSECHIQVVLNDTHEVRYIAPGATAQFTGVSAGSSPSLRVYNPSNGRVLQTISLQPISAVAYVAY